MTVTDTPSSAAAVELSGLQKAAVLLVMLGKERAANVIRHLGGTDLDELIAQVVRLRDVSPGHRRAGARPSSTAWPCARGSSAPAVRATPATCSSARWARRTPATS